MSKKFQLTHLGKNPIIRDCENYNFLNLNNACDVLNKQYGEIQKLKKEKGRLYDYFQKWFEDERCIYPDDFHEWWDSIRKGEEEY